MEIAREQGKLQNIICIFTAMVFFSFFFLFVLLQLNPQLFYLRQTPVFYFEQNFFLEQISLPGGLVEYIANFLYQSYLVPVLGALVITGVALLLTLATRTFLRHSNQKLTMPLFVYLPATLLLILHSHYPHTLALSLAFVITVSFAILFFKLNSKNTLLRGFIFLLLMLLLYAIAGAPFFLFALLCALYEALNRRSIVTSLLYTILAAVWPALSVNFFYVLDISEAYLRLLPFQADYAFFLAPFLLYAFYPVLFLIGFFIGDQQKSSKKSARKNLLWSLQNAVVIMLIVASAFFAFDQEYHDMLTINHKANQREWDEVLRYVEKHPVNHRLVVFQTIRALYHQGQLLDRLFTIPHIHRAMENITMSKEAAFAAPMENSDLMMDLGHINEAQHWAHEALASCGPLPKIFQRLFQISLLKGNQEFAEMCLAKLENTPAGKPAVKEYQPLLKNPFLISRHPVMAHARKNQVTNDFQIHVYRTEYTCKNILAGNPDNRMAFEYLMSFYLLTAQLDELVDSIDRFQELGYQQLPRYIEEAMILHLFYQKAEKPVIKGRPISKNVILRFGEFTKILAKSRTDKQAAFQELSKGYKDTYWYYVMFIFRRKLQEKISEIKSG